MGGANNRDGGAIGMNTAPRSDWILHFADKAVVQRGNGYCSPNQSLGAKHDRKGEDIGKGIMG